MQKATKYKINIGIGALIALIYVLIPIDVAPDAPIAEWGTPSFYRKDILLVLSPWPFDPKKKQVTRAECVAMNHLSAPHKCGFFFFIKKKYTFFLHISKKSSNFAAVMTHAGECGWASAHLKVPFVNCCRHI